MIKQTKLVKRPEDFGRIKRSNGKRSRFGECGAPRELKIEVPDIFGELGLSNGFDCFVIVEINGWTCATLFARDLWSRARKA